MPSIKDPSYRLPIVSPLRKESNFSSRANNPMLIRGVNKQSGALDDFVVKLNRAGRMSPAAAMRELLACFIGMELELPIAEPAAVEILPDFLPIIADEPDYPVAAASIGLNFATYYRPNFVVIRPEQKLANTQLDSAAEILAFDIAIRNPDRTHEQGKPNLNLYGKEILIFDWTTAAGMTVA